MVVYVHILKTLIQSDCNVVTIFPKDTLYFMNNKVDHNLIKIMWSENLDIFLKVYVFEISTKNQDINIFNVEV